MLELVVDHVQMSSFDLNIPNECVPKERIMANLQNHNLVIDRINVFGGEYRKVYPQIYI